MKVLSVSSHNTAAPASTEDAALLGALARDDEQAFAEIYQRYWDGLYAHACRKLGCSQEAEEVVQDIFVSLWNKRYAATDIQQLDSYLFAALKYRVIDCLRAQAVRQTHATAPAAPHPADRGTEQTVAVADLTAALAASLRQLPDHARAVFQLSRLEHRTVPEIAAHLQVSPKTVEYHLARSLRLLRSYLREFLVSALLLAIVNA